MKRKVFFIILVALTLIYYVGTFTLTVTKVEISSDKIKSDVTIVQVSDLHGATFGKNNSTLLRKIELQKPDIVVVTGDMYTKNQSRNKGKQTAFVFIKKLAEKHTVYFVTGEHDFDHTEEPYKELESYGVNVLHYKTELLNIKGNQIRLYGINSLYYTSTFDLSREFELDTTSYNIMLAHISNMDAFSKFGVDLAICGDTHGGQVRLPFLGPIVYQGTWLPKLNMDKEEIYDKGLFKKDDTHLFVSSGLGNYPIPLRILNRPEVVSITLKAKSK